MSGCWEIRKLRQVLVATLSVDSTSVAWAMGLRKLEVPGEMIALSGAPFDHARNNACQQLLDSDFQYLFFLDSDVVPPPDAIIRLMSHNLPIVSGVYYRRSPPLGFPVMMRRGPDGGLFWLTNYPLPGLVDVDVVGTGCMLIHRSVIEQLQPHPLRPGKRWFDWRVDLRGLNVFPDHLCTSEDYSFCERIKTELGIKILVDTSIQCRHIGLAESRLNLENGSIEFVPSHAV